MADKKTYQQKLFSSIEYLIQNGFRCKDEFGEFLNESDTNDILMDMGLERVTHIKTEYQRVIDERQETLNSIKPVFNRVMLTTGLGHLKMRGGKCLIG
jgi:hypothetical protein